MEMLAPLVFVFYAAVIAGGALSAVLANSLVRAMLGLIVTLFGVAGMYLLMNAPLVAFMQLLIYVGAVVVLIFFAIMLTRAFGEGDESPARTGWRQFLSASACLLPAIFLSWVIINFSTSSVDTPTQVPIKELGRNLLQPYILAFELISVVLAVAMAGAVLMTWEKRGNR